MGGSARALALLVWLAAIPIAAHAAAEASFEVSQVSGLRGWQRAPRSQRRAAKLAPAG